MKFDFVIIGSGPSGGRIAHELTKSGAKCALLEAGKHYTKKDFPLPEIDASAKLFWGGGIELSTDARLAFLRAKCVGGTSIVNQALLCEFDEMAWEDWRSRSGISEFTESEFAPHYEAVTKDISLQTIEAKYFNRNTKLFTESFDKKGLGWSPLHRGQKNCLNTDGTHSDCMSCLGGCPRDSKQSSMVTTIARAQTQGLTLMSEFEVNDLVYGSDSVKIRGTHQGKKTEIEALKVVLAAGSFGSTKILLNSGLKSKLPALGHGIAAHPQFMTYARFEEPVNAHKGAFQGVKSYDPKFRKMGIKLENVFAGPIATAMLFQGMGKAHQAKMKKYRYVASMEVAIRDEAVGQLSVDRSGKLQIKKNLTDIDMKKVHEGLDLVRELFQTVGGRDIEACSQVFGLHLMGGCSIGVDPKTSVVGPDFRVHGFPRLFIADSSVFPSAPGINPSFTIMALSQKASHLMTRDA